jgi:hypothetical protein
MTKIFGITGRMEHVNSDLKPTSGKVKYYVSGHHFFYKANFLLSLEYSLSADGGTSVYGKFEAEVSGFFSKLFAARIMSKFADEVIKDGEYACLFVGKNPVELDNKLA